MKRDYKVGDLFVRKSLYYGTSDVFIVLLEEPSKTSVNIDFIQDVTWTVHCIFLEGEAYVGGITEGMIDTAYELICRQAGQKTRKKYAEKRERDV